MTRQTRGQGTALLPCLPATIALALLVAWMPGTLARAQTSSTHLTQVEVTGAYQLEVDGLGDTKVQFYEGNPPVQVIVLSGNGTGFVLDRPTKSVRRLVSELARVNNTGSLSLLPGATGDLVPGGYQADGPGVRFSDKGHTYYVTMKPPLVGEVTVEKILNYSPEYRKKMDLYTPSVAAVKQLKECSPSARVELFYGSWCPFCRRHVPRLLKALEEAGNPVSIRIVALPRGFTNEKAAKDRGVTRVPTLIAYDGPREVGRLQGQDWDRPEEALVRILPLATAASGGGGR